MFTLTLWSSTPSNFLGVIAMVDIRYRIHQDAITGLFYANLLHPSQVYGQGKTAAEAVTSLKIALNVRKGVQR